MSDSEFYEISQRSDSDHRVATHTTWQRMFSQGLLIYVWLSVAFVMGCLHIIRWIAFTRTRRRNRIEVDPLLQQLVDQLAGQVGLRRSVRVEVLSGRTGPAVIGMFRAVILLPECVASIRQREQIEPIILHELTHVRRRDLWVSALQIIVRTVWWFHPLVWVADRLLTCESERACDEEVVAQLPNPIRYARALLDVLEAKYQLIPAPVVPGIRPVEITKERLERIMSLR